MDLLTNSVSHKIFAPLAIFVLMVFALVALPSTDAQASTACSTTGGSSYRALPATGDPGNEYLISTPEQLAYLATQPLDWARSFKQTADIDLRGCNWRPIGANDINSATFNGDYDGAGFSITNFFIDSTASGFRMGFFGATSGSTITNLRLQGTIRANSAPEVGALVGKASLTTITRVKVNVDVEATGSSYLGGIVGNLDGASSSVSYSSYRGTISANSSAGGIAGYANTSATMSNNYVLATISTTSTPNVSGGVVGKNGGIVVDSYAVTNAPYGLSGQSMSEVGSRGSFWDKDLGPTVTAAGSGTQPSFAAGKTADQMKMIETYTTTFPSKSWDIVNGWEVFSESSPKKIWGICSGVNDGYPFLLWEYTSNPCPAPPGGSSGSGTSAIAGPAIHLDLKANIGDQISGRPVEIAGTGLGGGSAYSLVVRSTPNTLDSGSASGLGSFSNTLRMPALPSGDHTLTLTATAPDGSTLSLVQSFTVSATGVVTAVSEPVGTMERKLAATGADSGAAMSGFAIAFALIASGVIARLATRRVAGSAT